MIPAHVEGWPLLGRCVLLRKSLHASGALCSMAAAWRSPVTRMPLGTRFWALVDVGIKLAITGILPFIAPGSNAQVRHHPLSAFTAVGLQR